MSRSGSLSTARTTMNPGYRLLAVILAAAPLALTAKAQLSALPA